jgi:Tfp pilus assembly protein PilE
MTQKQSYGAGFSAVELLITLFIAAAFITTGSQLYTVIIKNSDEARTRAKATNIAYDKLRYYSAQATNPCTVIIISPTLPSNHGLTNASISGSITCPYGTGTPTSKVEIILLHGTPQEEVSHALYITN